MVTIVTKIFPCYISVTVPDRLMVTIIHSLSFHTMTLICDDHEGHNRSCMVNLMKNLFSLSIFKLETSG